jgi:hypothetical protein
MPRLCVGRGSLAHFLLVEEPKAHLILWAMEQLWAARLCGAVVGWIAAYRHGLAALGPGGESI